MPPTNQTKLCAWEGCYSPSWRSADGTTRFCKTHFYKNHYATQGRKYYLKLRRQLHALLLKNYNFNPKSFSNRRVTKRTAPPMTPTQQLIYQQELNRLLKRFPPSKPTDYFWCCGVAAGWARQGGRLTSEVRNDNSHPFNVGRRKRGWRKKWLREGDYDPLVLDGLLEVDEKKLRRGLTKGK